MLEGDDKGGPDGSGPSGLRGAGAEIAGSAAWHGLKRVPRFAKALTSMTEPTITFHCPLRRRRPTRAS